MPCGHGKCQQNIFLLEENTTHSNTTPPIKGNLTFGIYFYLHKRHSRFVIIERGQIISLLLMPDKASFTPRWMPCPYSRKKTSSSIKKKHKGNGGTWRERERGPTSSRIWFGSTLH